MRFKATLLGSRAIAGTFDSKVLDNWTTKAAACAT